MAERDEPASPNERKLEFRVIVRVDNEQEQAELIELLEQEGFECKPLIS